MAGCYIVTGAAGFIGSHLARALLDRSDRVVGVDNYDPFYDRGAKEANAARLDGARFELIEADIRDRETMANLVDDLRPAAVYLPSSLWLAFFGHRGHCRKTPPRRHASPSSLFA